MSRLWSLFRILVLLLVAVVSAPLFAKGDSAPEAVLTVANREIVTLRATIQGATPEMRVKRIGERLRELDENALSEPVSYSNLVIDNLKGNVFMVGGRPIFSSMPRITMRVTSSARMRWPKRSGSVLK